MTSHLDLVSIVIGVGGLSMIPWAAPAALGAETALVVPALFVVAGMLGPVWGALRFTCRSLVAAGALHLSAFAASALAQQAEHSAPVWHVASQVLFVAGFAVFVVLAAGYPSGPSPRWAFVVMAVAAAVPLITGFAGATPPVLAGSDAPEAIGPIAAALPEGLVHLSVLGFALPPLAVSVGITRATRGGRELRARLSLPLVALVLMAAIMVAGALVPPQFSALSTALFLVAAPLVPVGLILGGRRTPGEPRGLAAEASPTLIAELTPRERDVLALMADGQSNRAIAKSLHISVSAVEKHSTAIFSKLGLDPEPATHRRVAAVVAYLRAAER
ncbi:helix-turn-helix transcriptional regulator [Ruicaihuangia caeni]|uniref:Helix-turn-helix transcriptional regulator n=1 Tax=Ruicaihuangia caeni TaxID=3042517 RepID=A0AAW6TBS1_9MICO|nr:helix-turn-helix transcriptional regulator [Klugiella sp. YN-L-19]MDI2099288.1 helix-turn-helix transcriptional regulator [Klugiella sp. YN-L-19]